MNVIQQLSFKAKIMMVIIALLLTSTVVSFVSASYFIKKQFSESESNRIESQLILVSKIVEEKFTSNLLLAKTLELTLSNLGEVLHKTGFHSITKVMYGYLFTPDNKVKYTPNKPTPNLEYTKETQQPFLDIEAKAKGKEIFVSDVYYEDSKPLISIARASEQASRGTDIFIVDMTSITESLEAIQTEGSFLELVDDLGNIIYSDKTSEDVTQLEKVINVAGKEWRVIGYIDNQYMKDNTAQLSNRINFVTLGFGTLIMFAGVVIIILTYRPIVALRELVEDLAHGDADLTKRLKVNNNDDISRISKGINKFVERLQELMLEVKDSSEESTKEIDSLQGKTTANKDMIRNHNEEIELAVTAVTEMSTTASTVAEYAIHATQQTDTALQAMESSKIIVEQAVSNVDSLTTEFDEMANSINTMVSDVEGISQVIDVIGAIQEQTNLLALNAAIEAARAGEQGRGFAVVADEVRALAGRTKQSTGEINDMLEKLQNGSKKVVNALEGTLNSCRNTSSNTNKIHDSLDTVGESVTNISKLNEQISESSNEQREVSLEIDKNMVAMRDMVLSLGENGDSASREMEELAKTNHSLEELVGQFKLK